MDKVEGLFQPGSFLELNSSLLLLFLLSHSVVSDSLRAHGPQHARLPCPSPFARACSESRPLSRWCHPTISPSVVPFSSHPQSSPTSGSFPVSQLFASGGQRSLRFHISPSSEYSELIYFHPDKILSRRIQSWVWRKPYYIGEHALPISLDELRGWIKKPRTHGHTHTLMVWEGSACCSRHSRVPESLDIFSGVWKQNQRDYNGQGECVTAECRGCYYIISVCLELSEINCKSRMRLRATFFIYFFIETCFFSLR